MSTLATLAVALTLTSEAYHKGLESASGEAEKTSKSITGSLSNIGKGIVFGAAALIGGGLLEMGKFMGESVTKAEEAQAAQAQLEAVLKSTGHAAMMSAEGINALSEQYAGMTKYSADTVLGGENILLTFTNIGKNFPQATEAMLNLSTAMNQDLKSSAVQLGKALNDPVKGMTALTRVGVTFTEEQKNLIKHLQATGDIAGAQTVILNEMNREFGNSAVAAGNTAAGGVAIFNHSIEESQEKIGGALLPTIALLARQVADWINSPAVQSGIKAVADGLSLFADAFLVDFKGSGNVLEGLANGFLSLYRVSPVFQFLGDSIFVLMDTFDSIVGAFKKDQGLVVGALTAIAACVLSFVVPALITLITTAAPIVLTLAAIGLAGYLLYTAWTTNFGGIRDSLTTLWTTGIKPIFDMLWAWLQVAIPAALTWLSIAWTTVLLPAIQAVVTWISNVLIPNIVLQAQWFLVALPAALAWLSTAWTTVLLPAIQAVWIWIQTVLFPLFVKAYDWLQVAIPAALAWLSTAWTTVLWPAIQDVYNWMTGTLFPFFEKIAKHFTETWDTVSTRMAGFWKKTLLPAFTDIYNFLNEHVFPIFKDLGAFFTDKWEGILKPAGEWIGKYITASFEGLLKIVGSVSSAVQGVITLIQQIPPIPASTVSNNGMTIGGIPGRAGGGPVLKGRAYTVGEKGIETFVPGENGRILPNGAGSTTNIYVSPHYYKGDEPSLSQELGMLGSLVRAY